MLLDLKMPLKDGFETLDWIRASETWRLLPVVVLTASAHRGDVEKAYRKGANAFLTKPASLEKLTELARAVKNFWLDLNAGPAGG